MVRCGFRHRTTVLGFGLAVEDLLLGIPSPLELTNDSNAREDILVVRGAVSNAVEFVGGGGSYSDLEAK